MIHLNKNFGNSILKN